MKLFFEKSDSLYKIFKTLEKINTQKTIHIYIDPEHSFFENERWWKQVKELFERRWIDWYFITKNDKSKYFFQSVWLKIIHQEKSKILKALNIMYLFFFNIKKFHLLAYNKKSYVFYVVFGFEVLFVLWVFYMLYSLILPSSKIEIKPSQQIESIIYNFRYYPKQDAQLTTNSRFINIPIYSWIISYKYELSISTKNIKYIQNPSRWQIKIINKTEKKYSFVPKTRFVTDDWVLFQTITRTEIPAWSEKQPSETIIKVSAMEKDENWIFIWERGNLPIGTQLYIKNLSQSLYLKKIYAEVYSSIQWWKLNTQLTVSQKDIDILSWRLNNYITQNKKDIISQNFEIKDWILIWFNDTISTNVKELVIENKSWDQSSTIKWYIIADLNFYYTNRDDIAEWFSKHISQRPSEKSKLITIDKNTLVFFDNIQKEWNIIIIPTKIDIIQWYDFAKDINWILDDLKTNIVWKTKEEVQKITLSYPEIAWVNIKIRPPWYNAIPKLKSRISFIFK